MVEFLNKLQLLHKKLFIDFENLLLFTYNASKFHNRIANKILKPCVHDTKNRSEISIREICSQSTCSFYGKTVFYWLYISRVENSDRVLASWTQDLR